MPQGELLTQPYQIEMWRNDTDRILMGPGTSYPILELGGLDIPSIRGVDFDLAADDGVFFPLRDLLQSRKIHGSFYIQANSGAAAVAAIDSLVRVIRPADFLMACTFQIPGRVKTFVTGRPRRLSYDKRRLELSGVTPADFEFEAADPIIYALDESTMDITLNEGENSKSFDEFHDGTYLSPPILTVVGPATNPRITNATYDNKQIKIDVILGAGATLAIDVKERTVKLNGADAYDLVRNDSVWWEVLPGQQTISYSRSSTTGSSTMTMTYRRAFVAV